MLQKKLSPIASALFSILVPGLGQIYNGQLKKGLYFFIISYLFYVIFGCVLQIFSTFTGLIVFLSISIGWILYLVYDSVINSIKKKEKEIKSYNRWYVYSLFIFFSIIIYDSTSTIIKDNYFRSFRIPSGGMEPTIVSDDYIVADMSIDYTSIIPGEIIIFKVPNNPSSTYMKRCVAVAEQKIEFQGNKILVDGKELKHGNAVYNNFLSEDSSMTIGPIEIPKGYCFVLGDNYLNSLDSRHFGFIPVNSIVGKPLYIYWAANKSRIGTYVK